MTKPEFTKKRSLDFSQWVKYNLPDSSTGYIATDVDFFLYNYKTKKIAIVEVKLKKHELSTWQAIFFKKLSTWIKNGIEKDWEFVGFYFIQFENTNFKDGLCYLNGNEITENELIEILSL